MSTSFIVFSGRSEPAVPATNTPARFLINFVPVWGANEINADVANISVGYINATTPGGSALPNSNIQDTATLTAINGAVNAVTGLPIRPLYSQASPYKLYVPVPAGALPNTVYEATIRIRLTTDPITNQGRLARVLDRPVDEALPLMASLGETQTFALLKPELIINKSALSLIVNTGATPVHSLQINIKPADEAASVATRQVVRTYFDASLNKYGTVARNGLLNIDLVQQDFSGTDINLARNDSQEYQIDCTVIAMDQGNYSTGVPIRAFFSPARVNPPSIVSVTQSNIEVNDNTLSLRFRPPSDLAALSASGIGISRFIITDGAGNISGTVSDNSGNMINLTDNSGNGIRYWLNRVTKQFIDVSGNVPISRFLGDIPAPTGQLDASGCYPIVVFTSEDLKNNRTITRIGITAVGTDNSASLTADFPIDFNGDSASGMWVAPARPTITASRLDNSGNLILTTQSFTRSLDVSGNLAVSSVDNSGNLLSPDVSFNNVAIASLGNNTLLGYNVARNYTLTVPFANLPGTLGIPNGLGVRAFDASGNPSAVSERFTYIKQERASKPVFALREVNDLSGRTRLFCQFDQSNNTIPVPNLGLGARDASANPIVEFTVQTRSSSDVAWTTAPGVTVPTPRYSSLTTTDASGVEIMNGLSLGQQVRVVGRIRTQMLTPAGATTQFVSDDSDPVLFSAINLTRPVTDINVVPRNDPRDLSGNNATPVDRSLTFTFNSPTSGAPLENFNLDVFVNSLASPVFSGFIDASGIPFTDASAAKNHRVTLTSSGDVNNLSAPAAFSGSRVVLTSTSPTTTADASFNITHSNLSFAWGDVVRVRITSVGRRNAENRLGDPAFADVVMVPSAPVRVTNAVISQDASLNDIVTYTIRNNGSALSNLTTMSVFWDQINEDATALLAPDMLSSFTFASSTIGATVPTNYTRNAGDISGNDNIWALTYPTLALVSGRANNIIDPAYRVFTGTVGRAGSAGPAVSTFGVRYLTGLSKTNANGSTNSLAGLKAAFSVLTGQNQKTNSTTSVTDYRLVSTSGPV
jgi:hypothetical protein